MLKSLSYLSRLRADSFSRLSSRAERHAAETARSLEGVAVSQHRSISRWTLGGSHRCSVAAVCFLLRLDGRRRLENH